MSMRFWLVPSAMLAVVVSTGSVASAQSSPGEIQVVGLRSLESDDVSVANTVTTALRRAASQRGYRVADNTANFDQESAIIGCATTEPDCLSLIAGDIHATRFIYGTVTHTGSGPSAQVQIEVSLWDEASHRIVRTERDSLLRSVAQPASLQAMSNRLFGTLMEEGGQAGTSNADVARQQEEAARRQREADARRVIGGSRRPEEPSHLMRYIGFGAIGVGAVMGGIGVWQWARTNDQQSQSDQANTPIARFANSAGTRFPDAAAMCTQAANDAATNSDARATDDLCKANATSRALALVLGIGGVVVAGVGAALVVVDSNSDSGPANARTSRVQLRMSPLLSPTVSGINMNVTF
jgi:hypothetical protein